MTSERLRFEVFGRRIDVEREDGQWVAYVPGADGKRRFANIPISANLDANEIAQYFDDLFHESASVKYPRVRLL
jgi:hypothetical protein